MKRTDTVTLEAPLIRCDIKNNIAYFNFKVNEADSTFISQPFLGYASHGIPVAGKKLDDWIDLLIEARRILLGVKDDSVGSNT